MLAVKKQAINYCTIHQGLEIFQVIKTKETMTSATQMDHLASLNLRRNTLSPDECVTWSHRIWLWGGRNPRKLKPSEKSHPHTPCQNGTRTPWQVWVANTNLATPFITYQSSLKAIKENKMLGTPGTRLKMATFTDTATISIPNCSSRLSWQ